MIAAVFIVILIFGAISVASLFYIWCAFWDISRFGAVWNTYSEKKGKLFCL